MTGITGKVQVEIKASKTKVWDALIKPEIVKQYFFGTNLVTDWKVGSAIFWRGEWEGKAYEDKGKVLQYEHQSKLQYTYWSGFSGQPDVPENYQTVTYQVSEKNGVTTLSITQENCKSEETRSHSEGNWKMVMNAMKELVEKK